MAGLSGVAESEVACALGALVRQRTLERSALIRERCPLLGQAHAVRRPSPDPARAARCGGSLAHADPAAELPAVMVALDARSRCERRRRAHRRRRGLLRRPLTTALAPDELLTEIALPPWPARGGSSLLEVAMRHGDFALGGVAATLTLDAQGRVGARPDRLLRCREPPRARDRRRASRWWAAPRRRRRLPRRAASPPLPSTPPTTSTPGGATASALAGVLTARALGRRARHRSRSSPHDRVARHLSDRERAGRARRRWRCGPRWSTCLRESSG